MQGLDINFRNMCSIVQKVRQITGPIMFDKKQGIGINQENKAQLLICQNYYLEYVR